MRPTVAAYYFPNYHHDARHDRRLGPGWTEWDLVRRAQPRYPGHQQPKVSAWGEFDESDPAWTAREIDLAADHGVDVFIYDWYWYNDGPFLQDGLDKGFLKAPNRSRTKFALMWANHDWIELFPAPKGDKPLIYPGALNRQAWERLCDQAVEQYFTQPTYWTIDGKPYFSIYEIGRFIAGLGGLEQAAEAIAAMRAKAVAAGLPGVHINIVVWGLSCLPSEVAVRDPKAIIDALGADSATTYAWVHHYNPNQHGFPKGSYDEAFKANRAAWTARRAELPIPYHPNVSMGWDSSPRTIQSQPYEQKGYPWIAVLEGNTPAAFRAALIAARDFAVQDPRCPAVVLNAWNEWTEGSYLLPDTVHGLAYLEAVREVFGVEEQ